MKILVAVDGSDASARAARFVAESLPGPHEVRVAVVLSYSLYPYREGPELIDRECERRAREEVECASTRAVGVLQEANNHVTIARRFGYPADELVDEIEEWEPELVVM